MKTEGIRRLVSALGKNPYQENQRLEQQKAQQAPEASRVNSDAVKISFSFSSSPVVATAATSAQVDKSDNSAKVNRIKDEVAKGTYNVSSEKIATALVTELGF